MTSEDSLSNQRFCPQELESSAPGTPGRVEDTEQLCRAGYSPMHGSGEKLPKNSLLKLVDLALGSLSVWRFGGVRGLDIEGLLSICNKNTPDKNDLWKIFSVTAGEVRARVSEDNVCVKFCVIDDTYIDSDRNYHAAHAVIGVCERFGCKEIPSECLASNEQLLRFRDELRLLFLKNVVWSSD